MTIPVWAEANSMWYQALGVHEPLEWEVDNGEGHHRRRMAALEHEFLFVRGSRC